MFLENSANTFDIFYIWNISPRKLTCNLLSIRWEKLTNEHLCLLPNGTYKTRKVVEISYVSSYPDTTTTKSRMFHGFLR